MQLKTKNSDFEKIKVQLSISLTSDDNKFNYDYCQLTLSLN